MKSLTLCLNFTTLKSAKKELKQIVQYAKEEPKKFIIDFLSVACFFGFAYLLLLFAAILEGNA